MAIVRVFTFLGYLARAMTRTLSTLLLLFAATGLLAHGHDHDHGQAVLQFHLNKGQWPQQVLFKAVTPGGALFVERDAFTYVLSTGGEHLGHGKPDFRPEPLRMHAYKVHFEGAMAKAHVGGHALPHYVNYFLGDDPTQWAGGVPVFAEVELKEMYPGIGMRIDGHDGMKYDWLVAPGADPSRITMRYEGQSSIGLKHGLVFIETTAGRVVEQRPVAWQVVHGNKRTVECRYTLDGDRVGFEFPYGYDQRYPLVIDPAVVFSSYSGSSGDNFGFTATYDNSGHLYGGGMVRSTGYPVTLGVIQPNYGGGENDIAISKFTPTGNALVWSTYIGGTANEVPHSMVVNSNDELYILGTTNSLNFPTTVGCWQTSFAGGTNPPFAVASYGFSYPNGSDIVVVHLNNTATALIGSTYVGGSGNDGLNQQVPTNRNYGDPFRGEIIMDPQEQPLVISSTVSTNLFTSLNAVQTNNAGGVDAYVFRMDPQLTTMLWATYFGGSGTDAGFGIQTSSTGEIYITGGTTSTNLPAGQGTAAFPGLQGGTDGFIARFHPSGSPLISRTYVGTSGFDQSYFVQLNTADEVFVVGQTTGPYPITPGKYNNPNATQFLHKFSGDLSASLWSTRIGGAGNEHISPSAFLVSNCGQIYFSGWGGSTNSFGSAGLSSSTFNLPVTPDAFQSTTDGSDFYLMMLELEAVALGYATFFGGSSAEHVDGGTSRFDKDGIVYQAVCAGCGLLSYPTTPGAWSNTNNSNNCNLGVFKIDFEQAVIVGIDVDTEGLTACLGSPILFTAVGNASNWWWDMGDGTTGLTGIQVTHQYGAEGEYIVTLIGTDSVSCNFADTAFVSVTILTPPEVEAMFEWESQSDCQGFSAEFFNMGTPGMEYSWQFGDGGTSTTINPLHAYGGPGTYEVTLTVTDPLCGNTATITETIILDPPSIEIELPDAGAVCDGVPVTLDAGPGFETYTWSTGATGQSINVTQPGTYWVVVTDGICVGTDTVLVQLQPPPPSMNDVLACPGEPVVLTAPFPVASITWSNDATTPSITVTEGGDFSFFAVDTLGCIVIDSVSVVLITESESVTEVPNVFSPNNDGVNDTFRVEGNYLERFSMEVFNRWGQLVFESTNPLLGWNGGLDNSGARVPDGTYFYVVSFKDRCSDEPLTTHTGHVTLLR